MPRIEGETYFDNFGQTGYEEFRDWTPTYYRSIKEADVGLRFAGGLKDRMAEALEELCRNQFAKSMGEYMLGRMEKFFHMEGNGDKSLSERRRLLSIALSGTGKMCRERIADIVRRYTGREAAFSFPGSVFFIHVDLDSESRFYSPETLEKELKAKLPAHLAHSLIYALAFVIDAAGAFSMPDISFRYEMDAGAEAHAAVRLSFGLEEGAELAGKMYTSSGGLHFYNGELSYDGTVSYGTTTEEDL